MAIRRTYALGCSALVVAAVLWGSNHVLARAVRDMVPLPSLVFWRWFIAALLLTPIAVPGIRRAWPFLRRYWLDVVLNSTLGVGAFSYLLIGAAYNSLALEVGIINATIPLWIALIGMMIGHAALSARAYIGLAVAFAGTLIALSKGNVAAIIAIDFNAGNLMALLAAITFAWFSIRARAWSRDIDALTITVVSAWCGILTCLLPTYLIWLLAGGQVIANNPADQPWALAAVAYSAVFPTMLGNLLFYFGVACLGAARAASFLYLSPIAAIALSIAFLDERLQWFHAVGFAVIVAGLLLLGRSDDKKA